MLNFYTLISKNKLYTYIIVCSLTLFILSHLIYFENFSRNVVKNDFSAKKFNFIKDNGDLIEVAAIGTSHTYDAFITNTKSYFFNYGRPLSWYPHVAYAKSSHLMKYLSNLKVILLEVDHINIFAYDSKINTSMPDKHLYLLKNATELLYEKVNNENTTNDKPFLLSLQPDVAPVIHRKYIQELMLQNGNKKDIELNWEKLSLTEKQESAKKRLQSYSLDKPLKIDKAVYEYYLKTISKAQKLGIKIYLVFYPQTKEYLEGINEANNLQLNKFIKKLLKFDNVNLLDYRYYFKNKQSSFANQDHVNKKGSKILLDEIERNIRKRKGLNE